MNAKDTGRRDDEHQERHEQSEPRQPAAIPLKKFVEYVLGKAEKIFKKNGRLLPMYHMIDSQGRDVVMPSPHENKNVAVAAVKHILKEIGATRVAYLDEAWSLNNEDNSAAEVAKAYKEGDISRHPKRIEIIMVSAEDRDEGIIMAYREIIRHGNNAVLGKMVIMQHGEMEGRMVGLLPTPAGKKN